MLEVNEAREKLLSHFSPAKIETIHFSESAGRVLAETIASEWDSPMFTHSAVDGVAVKASDLVKTGGDSGMTLNLDGRIAAGDDPIVKYRDGTAALIMTGAPLPEWADAVVKVEDTDLDFNLVATPDRVQINTPVRSGENVRFRGENLSAGSVLWRHGHRISPQDVGALAMMGRTHLQVYHKPLIGIFASGDELVEPGRPIGHGQIWNSNSYMLSALVRNCGAEVMDLGIVPDRKGAILEAFETLEKNQVDLMLTSGGVSMGMFDYIRKVVEEQGVLDFWKVNMRPGKPLAFGKFRAVPFIGLPGNPVSSFVGALVFVCPAISRMAGLADQTMHFSNAHLEEEISLDGRETYIPGMLSRSASPWQVRPIGNQSSGNLYALVQANCLIKIAPGVQSLKRDSLVEVFSLDR